MLQEHKGYKTRGVARIVVCVMVLVIVILLFKTTNVYAVVDSSGGSYADPADQGMSLMGWIGVEIAQGVGLVVMGIASFFLNIAQAVFNYALKFNLSFADKLPAIEAGWKVSRDVANIFFIVVLLIIAIGTILRIGGYDAKKMVPTVIVVALFINFSLAIGSIVVDSSNVLGLQFYNAITKNGTRLMSDVIGATTGIEKTKNLSQDLTKIKNENAGKVRLAIILWGNAMVMFVLLDVFLFAAIMLAIRMVAISIILMLAPMAFLFLLLPDTKAYFNQWWSKLLHYSFFFPAFMFMLYFSITFINNVKSLQIKQTSGTFLDNGNENLVFSYIVVVILLISSLSLANKMGLSGANTALAWAKKSRRWAQGYVGAAAATPVRMAARGAIGSEKVERLQSWLTQKVPFGLGAGVARGVEATLQRGALLGSRVKSAEKDATWLAQKSNAALAQDWSKLTYAQKQALLKKLPEDRRKQLMGLLSDDERALAERMARGFEGEKQAGGLEAAEWQRIKASGDPDAHQKSMEYFANMSRAGKEQALRTMNQKEQSDYADKLRQSPNTNLRRAAGDTDEIIRTEFTGQQRAAYDVAGYQRLSTGEQLSRSTELTNESAAAFLHGKSPEERGAFIESLRQRARDAQAGGNTAEAQRFIEEAARMDQVMRDYFSPEDLKKHEVAIFNTFKDPAAVAFAWGGLSAPIQEEIMRARDAKQRASLLNSLQKHGQPNDYANATQTMRDALTRAELAKTNAILNIRQTGVARQSMFDKLEDIDIGEVFNELKTPEEQWEYINSLTATQQPLARDIMNRVLSPDAKDDYAAYEVINKSPSDSEMAKGFVNKLTTRRQRLKAIRSVRGQRRADIISEIQQTTGGDVAISDLYEGLTEQERDRIHRELCGQLKDTYV